MEPLGGASDLLSGRPCVRATNVVELKYFFEQIPFTGVYFGIYEEGIYMVKVILTEIRHFECPNQKN